MVEAKTSMNLMTKARNEKYPHRVVILNRSVDQILLRLKYLIDRKIETKNSIESTSIKYLTHKYFPNAIKDDVTLALGKLRSDT